MAKQILLMLWGLCLILLAGCYRDIGDNDAITSSPIINWQPIVEGIEERTLQIGNNNIAQLYILRIDSTLYRFETHYQPTIARTIDEWREELPNAKVIINANFFDASHTITGLLIRNGEQFGWHYTDRGGTFAVRDGNLAVTSNIYQPFDTFGVQHAVQGFPMLVYNGEMAYNQQDGRASRRTIIGQDRQGRILLMVTPITGTSLHELSNFLANSDLELVNAFNLDGGRSTMLFVADKDYFVRSFERVPAVLAIYAN